MTNDGNKKQVTSLDICSINLQFQHGIVKWSIFTILFSNIIKEFNVTTKETEKRITNINYVIVLLKTTLLTY